MEWVETTAKTVEAAKELALDQLGVDEADAEFEVLEEPRPGLFGRVRGEARVRARIRPTRPRPKVERRDRKRKEREDKPERRSPPPQPPTPAAPAPKRAEQPMSEHRGDEEGATDRRSDGRADSAKPTAADVAVEAEKFVGGLLDALGLDGTTTVARDGDELDVAIDGPNLGLLIGPRGTTLLAVQDLVRVAAQRRIGDHDTRLRVDINGYREKRRAALGRFAVQQADEVASSGEARVLEPMPSADRKVIHDALLGRTDVVTRSEGEDPARRVVIMPAPAPGDSADETGSADAD